MNYVKYTFFALLALIGLFIIFEGLNFGLNYYIYRSFPQLQPDNQLEVVQDEFHGN